MTIHIVKQIVGCLVPIERVAELLGKDLNNYESIEDFKYDNRTAVIASKDEQEREEEHEDEQEHEDKIMCFRLTHDIYEDEDETHMAVGVLIFSMEVRHSYVDNVVDMINDITIEEICTINLKVKEWMAKNNIEGSPKILTIVDDCICCS
jgi:hypothetical protein